VSAAITTHVLDTARGRPAAGVAIVLERADGERVGAGATDADGRLRDLGSVEPGDYRLTFDTGGYFAAGGQDGFYPEVVVSFTVAQGEDHYHVPLLLNPYGYSTYRGS
jgi:5-hydroxyisourate hydrolase